MDILKTIEDTAKEKKNQSDAGNALENAQSMPIVLNFCLSHMKVSVFSVEASSFVLIFLDT